MTMLSSAKARVGFEAPPTSNAQEEVVLLPQVNGAPSISVASKVISRMSPAPLESVSMPPVPPSMEMLAPVVALALSSPTWSLRRRGKLLDEVWGWRRPAALAATSGSVETD